MIQIESPLSEGMAVILIAEPSPLVRGLLEQIVEDLGHFAATAAGATGLDDPACDVLLLEPTWPGAGELAQRLHARDPHVPIILVGSTEEPELTRSLTERTRVAKPFAVADLHAAIDDALATTRCKADVAMFA